MKFSTSIIAIALAQTVYGAACRNKHRSEAAAQPSGMPQYGGGGGSYPSAAPAKPSAVAPAPSVPAKAAPSAYPSSAPAPGGSGTSPMSGGKPLIDSINVYRKNANLPLFTWDDTLTANCYKTVKDSGGTQLAHELNPGSFGQVLVYGFDDADKCTKDTKQWTPFEIFWYSWLCERSEDPALGGICQQIWDIGHIADGGQTGHHDILANGQYKKIGCAFYRNPAAKQCDSFPGVWGCDVA